MKNDAKADAVRAVARDIMDLAERPPRHLLVKVIMAEAAAERHIMRAAVAAEKALRGEQETVQLVAPAARALLHLLRGAPLIMQWELAVVA